MQKLIFLSLAYLSLSTAVFSAERLTPQTALRHRSNSASLVSQNIGETAQYLGLPQVPLVHHYNDFNPPEIILAIKGKLSEGILLQNPQIEDMMEKTGVRARDPFMVVVQGFSQFFNDSGADISDQSPLLLRPMYYFSQNKAASYPVAYSENITLKAGILGITSDLAIVPEHQTPSNQFGISIHNSGPGTNCISSAANMAVPQLRYNQSTAFYGFYKGVNRAIIGDEKDLSFPDTRGVTVLHVLLDDIDRQALKNALNHVNNKSIEGVSEAIQSLMQAKYNLLSETIDAMLIAEIEEPMGKKIKLIPAYTQDVQTVTREGDRTIIRTSPSLYSYQVLGQVLPVKPLSTVRLSYDIDIKVGGVGLGLLNQYKSFIKGSQAVYTSTGKQQSSIEFVIPHDVTSMQPLIYNNSYASSEFCIDSFVMKVLSTEKLIFDYIYEAQTVNREENRTFVRTSSGVYPYQVASQILPVEPLSTVKLSYNMDIEVGCVALGVLDQHKAWINGAEHAILNNRTPPQGSIKFSVPNNVTSIQALIYNNYAEPSEFWINSLEFEVLSFN
ncbi:hypothetical protein [Candidatus Paracaedibacter symbiosus]|uniref:hypothetical protein n=1 Tax=Candidatus Paracaedibacter symbiosus TaxID=244582 RepID=UPI00050976C3|nr:hypothetical protein [Candidatus Paracaedibacter symbiosus]